MEKNNEINILISNKYSLSERVLDQIMDDIYGKTGVSVICYETKNGYVFKDERFLIPIADLKFNVVGGKYSDVEIYDGGVEEVRIREAQEKRALFEMRKADRAKERKRKFRLQVGGVIAASAAITIAGMGVLMAMGVIDTPFGIHRPTVETTKITIAQEQKLNTLNSANDILLVGWMNYAMDQVRGICSGETAEYLSHLGDEVYMDYFAPAMSAYYDYLDYNDADMPLDVLYGDKDVVASAHDRFRMNAVAFANYLKESAYFSGITFSSSPFANAVVTDTNGNVLLEDNNMAGVLIGADGVSVATNEDSEINIKVTDIPNSPYSLNDLPDDAKMINGDVYVSVDHLYQEYGSLAK